MIDRVARSPKTRWLTCIAFFFPLLLASCRGAESASSSSLGGTVVISTSAEPQLLLPPLVSTLSGRQISDLVFDRLAEIGDSLNISGDQGFRPRLAKSWTWSADSMTIAFHMDPRARWHDGHTVSAQDVKFSFDLYTDSVVASPSRALLADIESVSVQDSATAVFHFGRRTSQQFFDAVYHMHIVPSHIWSSVDRAHLRESTWAREPIGTGRFRFYRWTPGGAIELVADTSNFLGSPQIARVVWTVSPEYATALTRLLSGEADVFETLRTENIRDLESHPELRIVSTPGLEYGFLQFNLRDPKANAKPHPLFSSRDLRRALTMAIDRNRIVKSVFDSLALPALGPTSRILRTTDSPLNEIPFDPVQSAKLLDSLGWRMGADGIHARNGVPLRFTLAVPSSSKNRVRLAVLVQAELKGIGVEMHIEELEFNAFVSKEVTRDFDAVMGVWHLDPSPVGLRETWGIAGARANGSNYGTYMNQRFDAFLDSALASRNASQRARLFRTAYNTILGDAPAVWLYEPRPFLAVNRRIRTSSIRPDAWWAAIADWSIPKSEWIARDRIPLPSPATASR